MAVFLDFFRAYELWIYLLLVVIATLYLRKLLIALHDWCNTLFGLERQVEQKRISEAVSVLVLVVCMGVVIFSINTFVPSVIPSTVELSTPTLNPLAIATTTLAMISAPAVGTQALTTTTPPVQVENGCVAGKVELTFPKNGSSISGIIDIKGTVKVNNFGFLKYEYAPSGSTTWATIAASHDIKPPDSVLGSWDTSMLTPGVYLLRLVVEDNGKTLPACAVSVTILALTRTP
jgi:hypothetical protein